MQLPNLKRWRELRGLTQRELSAQSGVSPRAIAGYEAGAEARPGSARKLATTLDVDIMDLAGVDQGKESAPPSVQLTLNGLLAEERRPTDREIKALNRHLAYVEQRLDADSMSRDEAADELDVSRVLWRTVKEAQNPELTDRHMAITQRVFDKAKELKARRLATAEGVLEDMREWRKQRAS